MRMLMIAASILGVLLATSGPAFAQQADFVTAQRNSLERNQAGDFEGALVWAEQMLAIAESQSGPRSPAAATAHLSIALQHQSLGRFAPAETHFRKGLAIQEQLVKADDATLAPFIGGLGGLLFNQGRYKDAEPYIQSAVRLQERGARETGDESGLAVAVFMLGSNYTNLSRLDDGQRLLERALALFTRLFPAGSPQAAIVLNNLATNRQFAGDFTAATDYQERALAMFRAFAPQNPYGIAKINNNLGFLLQRAGKPEQAAEHYRQAIAALEQLFPNGHADIATARVNYAAMLIELDRLDEAEPLLVSALAMRRRLLPHDHPEVALAYAEVANLAIRHGDWSGAIAAQRASAEIYLARAARQDAGRDGGATHEIADNAFAFTKLVKMLFRGTPQDAALAFEMAQHVMGSSAAASLAQMAARSAKGDAHLSDLVRSRQDLVAEWQALDKELVAALSKSDRDTGPVERIRREIGDKDARIAKLDRELSDRFPEFAALASPTPLSIEQVQASLAMDEALILILDTPYYQTMPEETFVFVITKTSMRWLSSQLGSAQLEREVAALRCGLDFAGSWEAEGSRCERLTGVSYTAEDNSRGRPLPFDAARAHALYRSLLGPATDLLSGRRLLVVASGPLSKLPLQVLVTAPPDPARPTDYAGVAWLARSHATTVLPAVSSLRALRQNARPSSATEAFLGFGNPVLKGDCGPMPVPDRCPEDEARTTVAALPPPRSRSAGPGAAAGWYMRDGLGNAAAIRELCPLPDTVHELTCVARSLGASQASLRLGPDMTEAALKRMPLDRYRVLHFATHGLLAGETANLSKAHAEPALVMTPPDAPTEEDDGLLTASEIAALKLDADWVIMSACNTASGGVESAEALSGLARAFFYAGARTLLVSHWPVNSYAATLLTSSSFAQLRREPGIGRAEAFRRAMLSLIDDKGRAWAAHPAVWAPFVIVGEGGAGR